MKRKAVALEKFFDISKVSTSMKVKSKKYLRYQTNLYVNKKQEKCKKNVFKENVFIDFYACLVILANFLRIFLF